MRSAHEAIDDPLVAVAPAIESAEPPGNNDATFAQAEPLCMRDTDDILAALRGHYRQWGKTFSIQLSQRDSKWYRHAADMETPLLLALEFMGGGDVFTDCPASRTDLHYLILKGVPGKALDRLISNVTLLTPEQVGEAVGVSTRTLRRRKETPEMPLNPEQGGRAFRFAELLARAAVVFGEQEEAERWFDTPAMGLDQKKPIDLVSTQVGAQLVDEFLGRIEHGVYA